MRRGWRKTPRCPAIAARRPPQRRGPRSGSTCPRTPATAMCMSSARAAQFPFADRRRYTPPPGERQRALGAAAGAASVARRDRAAERLRHQQFLHARRHAPARCGPRPRRRGDRRGDFGRRTRHDAPGRHPRRARQSRNRRRERPRSGAASAGGRGGAGRGEGLACPGLYAAAGHRGLERGGRAPAGAGRLRSFRRRAGRRRRRAARVFGAARSGPGRACLCQDIGRLSQLATRRLPMPTWRRWRAR